MRKLKFIILFLLILSIYSPFPVFAQVVPSDILINQAKDYDQEVIEFSGEVVGEAMKRGDFTWINVYDKSNALGVWLKNSDVGLIKFSGDYAHKGDVLLIRGIFHRACPQHGGDLDIHANSIIKLEDGYVLSHGLPPQEKRELASVLLFLLFAVALLLLIRQRRNKKYGHF